MAKILPQDFRQQTIELMGEQLFAQIENSICNEEPPTSIRFNRFKAPQGTHICTFDNHHAEEGTASHHGAAPQEEPVPWCPDYGRYLEERPNFTFDPLLHAGVYYVQEASSMFVDLVARQLIQQPVRMLDLCAAPGGKSTALRNALPQGSLLISNEPMRTRAQILAENIQKFGHPDTIVTNNYPKDFRKAGILFDAILADVPCSGEGMFRKDDGAIEEWSTQNVDNCSKLQRSIIEDIWPCLKPGGLLIYSTCTYNVHEDEENVAHIIQELGATPVQLDIDEAWAITGNLSQHDFPVYRFLPGKSRGEGLFLAVLRKAEDADAISDKTSKRDKGDKSDKVKKKAKTKNKAGNPQASFPAEWLKQSENYETAIVGDRLYAIPQTWHGVYAAASQALCILHAGIEIGKTKGKDFIPAQNLALSTERSTETFALAELSYTDAIRFLRKEAVTLPEETPKGYVLVTYRGIPLGWEKNIGNRANNLYPQEWKIKSTHVPETDKPIITW